MCKFEPELSFVISINRLSFLELREKRTKFLLDLAKPTFLKKKKNSARFVNLNTVMFLSEFLADNYLVII